MKKYIFLLIIILTFLTQFSFADEPSTQASNINFTVASDTSIIVNWTRGNGSYVIILANVNDSGDGPVDNTTYSADTVYGDGSEIYGGRVYHYVVYIGTGTSVHVSRLSANTKYEFVAYEFNGSAGSENYNTTYSGNFGQQTTAPSTQSNSITFSSLATTSMTTEWTNGNGEGRIVAVKEGVQGTITNPAFGTEYTASSNWSSKGDQLGSSGYYVVYNGTGSNVSLSNLAVGTNYWVQVFDYKINSTDTAYNTNTASDNPKSQSTLKATPTVQASNVTFSNVASTTMTVGWTRAGEGGGDYCLVVAEEEGDVNSPSDGTDYTADAAFGSGTPSIGGTGTSYVVYKGTGTSVDVTALTAGTSYTFKVFEFNNTGSNTKYYVTDGTDNPDSQTTLATEPSTQAHTITFSSLGTTTMTIGWTDGNGSNRIVAVSDAGGATSPSDNTTYSASTDWNSKGTQLGSTGYYTVYNGSSSSVSLTNLSANTKYYVRVFEYNGSSGSENYYTVTASDNPNDTTTLKTQPSSQANSISFSSIAETTLTATWVRGGGDSVIVVTKQGSAVSDFPVDDNFYSADAAFQSGTQIGTGNYVVYRGTGTTVDITALTGGNDYYFRAFEFNNGGTNSNYLTGSDTDNPNNTTTLNGEPSTQATTIAYSNISTNQIAATASGGNGTNRIILVKAGSAVNGTPTDGTEYTGNSSFESGDQIGSGNYVVSAGSGSSVTVTSLSENTRYYFKVFEYNNTGSNTNYKIDGFSGSNPSDTITTKSAPSTQATNITFSNITSIGIDLSWTRGDGDSIMIVAKAGSTLAETPTAGTAYNPDSNFGDGNTIASGCYVVYTGTGTNVSITGLTASSEYTFKAFEFNNPEPYTSYLNTDGTNNPQSQYTVSAEPTTQAKDISFTNIQSNQISLSATIGNGTNRLVLAHINTTIDANPIDGFAYTANSSFGNGDEIGTGNYVVYNGSGTGVTAVTNLLPDTVYYFKVYEYNGADTAMNYLISDGVTGNPASQRTALGKPNTQASDIVYSSVSTTSYTISWTSTDGDSVLVVGKVGSTLSETPTDGTSYAADANYGDGNIIATGCNVVYNGNGTSVAVTGLTANTNYTFKVFAFNKVSGSAYYQDVDATDNPLSQYTLATEPTTQAGTISFSNKKDNQVDLTWTRGSTPGDGVIVLASEVDITSLPVDGTGYTSSSVYGSGDAIGSHYVVFNGSGTGVTVTGLSENTKYYFRAFEYNGSNTSSNYYTSTGSSTNTTTLKAEPSTQANNITFSNIDTTEYTVNWTRGDVAYDGVIIVARQGSAVADMPVDGTTYTANPSYGSGSALGTGYVVYDGTGTTVNLTNLSIGTEYHLRVFEYNNSGSDIDYLTTTSTDNPNSQYTLDNRPGTQVTSFATGTIGSNSIPLSWTAGDGTGRIVLAKQGSAVSAVPVDTVTYSADTAFGAGDEIGTGNFVVYATTGSGTSVEVGDLLGDTDYHFQIFEYNDNGAINYRTSDGPVVNATTGVKAAPTTQASAINFTSLNTTSVTINWTSGNGEKRIVAVHEGTGAITDPSDNATYAASTDWSSKGTELGSSGYYTVYNGTEQTVSITNLAANTKYIVQIFEYNNPSGKEKYNTSTATANPDSTTTLKASPSTQASAISLTNKTTTSFTVNWTDGNGDNRIVVARATATSNVTPTDLTDYSANSTFGSGDITGTDNYVVYNGSGSSVAVSGLTASTSYTFVVYDYNNLSTNAIFNTSLTDDANYKDSTTLGPATWDGSTDTDWNTAANWDINTVPTSSYSVIIADVTNQPVVGANHSVENLTVDAGAWLTINDGYTLTVSGDVTLETPSGSGATGAVGQIVIPGTGVLSVSGSSTMNRNYPTTTYWRFVSAPITSPDISEWTGYYVNDYDEPNATWKHLNSSSSISVMQGLSVLNSSGASTLSFEGTFNTGNQSINVTNSSGGDDLYGWNIVGNPYPSAIDWGAQTGITRTSVDAAAYLYDSGSGGYTTITTSGIIAAGQGFFVHASDNGSLAFTNAARTASTQAFRKNTTVERVSIKLEATNDFYTTEAVVMFDENATSEFDGEYDAFKLMSVNDAISDIYTIISSGTILAINALNTDVLTSLPEQGYAIPIGLTPGFSGNVKLSAASIENIPNDIYIYLYDKYDDIFIDLRSDSYEIFIESQSDNRFELRLSPNVIGINEAVRQKLDIFIYTHNKTTFIKSDIFEKDAGTIQVFDITGKLVQSKNTEKNKIQLVEISQPGTYIFRILVKDYVVTKKAIVR